MSSQAKRQGWGDRVWQSIIRQIDRLRQPKSGSTDYQSWQHLFLLDRLRLAWLIAVPFFTTMALHGLYIVLGNAEQFNQDAAKFYGSVGIADQLRNATITTSIVTPLLLLVVFFLQQSSFGKRHSALLFLSLSGTLTVIPQIIHSSFGLPMPPDTMVFLAQAALIPVHWRLHLTSQLISIAYLVVVCPLLGLVQIGNRSIYDSYAIGGLVHIFWVCVICDIAVLLYERLKRSEFESQRQLKVFLHSVTHDLQTPVLGTSMLLKSLLDSPDEKIEIERSVLERLLEGNHRQITLINSLLEAHRSEVQNPALQLEPLALSQLVESVLANLEPLIAKHQISLENRIQPSLPLVYADFDQLWRVFCNLISNALKHNPPGTQVILNAEVMAADRSKRKSGSPLLLRCTVSDNGVGIPPEQRGKLFELYARGSRARYMPGLGLGLYLCRQIVQAHGGEIGVVSEPNAGSTFWFTLPIATPDPAVEPTSDPQIR